MQVCCTARCCESSVPHAEVLRVDASRAETLPGVVAVLTGKDVVDNPRYQTYYGPVVKDQTIVAVDRVRFVGDPVAAVAATHPEIAEEALELIEVDYEELPAVLDPEGSDCGRGSAHPQEGPLAQGGIC